MRLPTNRKYRVPTALFLSMWGCAWNSSFQFAVYVCKQACLQIVQNDAGPFLGNMFGVECGNHGKNKIETWTWRYET